MRRRPPAVERPSLEAERRRDRRRAEEALRESEERLRTVVSNAPIILFALDREGVFTLSEGKALDALGLKPGEVVGQSVFDVYRDVPEIVEKVRRALAGEEFTAIVDVDGLTFESRYSPVRDENGEVTGVIGVATDITEHRRAEEALQESEERYRDLVENINEIIYAVDTNGVITYVSPVVEQLGGYSPEEVIGRSVTEFIHPDDLVPLMESFQRTVSGNLEPFEYRVLSKSGETHWVRTSSRPVFEGDRMIGLRAVLMDITDHKRAEEALRESQDKYRRLVEDSIEGIAIVEGLEVRFVNPAMLEMFGYQTEEEIVGRPFTDLVSPEYRQLLTERGHARDRGEEVPARYEFKALRKDGTQFDAEVSVSRITYEGGIARQGVIRDISERKRAEEALRESEERYRLLAENASDVIWTMDMSLRYTYVSPSFTRLRGYSAEEMLGSTVRETLTPASLAVAQKTLAEELAIEKMPQADLLRSRTLELEIICKDGSTVWTEAKVTFLRDHDNQPVGILGVSRDISERKGAEEALRQSEERYRSLIETSPDAITLTDLDGIIIMANQQAAALHRCDSAEEMVGKSAFEFIAPEDQSHAVENMRKTLEAGTVRNIEYTLLRKDGTSFPAELSASCIQDPEGKPKAFIGVVRDITERKRAEETIRYLAYHDGLTGLPNPTLFKDRLDVALAQARRNKQMVAVMFLDLDRFKVVNDTVGHAGGDELLGSVAEHLTKILREVDTVARVGGDEFALLVPGITRVKDAVDVAQRVLEGLREPRVIAGHEFHVTTSIGIALYPSDGQDAETLLRNADTAMYRAKEQGRDNYQLFIPSMNANIVERAVLENDLRYALGREEFVVYYQPQLNINTGEIVGMEALVRWQHPGRGLVYPDDFIPLAEDTGLIVPLGDWVLRTACAQNKAWQEAGLPPLRVAVNLSARQFQPALIELVGRVLKDTGLDPQCLELEITEGIAMRDVDFTVTMLRNLREMGVTISIDDFGTGYSSLGYLKRFPIDGVKIDRSFVRDITVDPEDAAIVTAIVGLAQSLNLRAIAEGVETEEQLAFLKERQCWEMQGYLFSRPVPAEEFEKILRKGSSALLPPSGLAAGR